MKKTLLSLLALFVAGSALATEVQVTMNAKSKLIQSLVNTTTGENVAVGEPASNKYTFEAPDGTYLLTATAADGETVSGTIQLTIDENNTAFSIFSPEVNMRNKKTVTVDGEEQSLYWELGTDYTIDLRVTTKEGDLVNTTLGRYTNGHPMFLVFNGNTYYVDVVPSEEHQAEGYLPVTYTGTVTFNATISAEAPMGVVYSISVPTDADLFVGTKTAHYVKFNAVEPLSVETQDGAKVYTYKLADKQQYNYRVTAPGKLTQAGLFTMSTDETKRPVLSFTDEDLTARSPKYVDHDVNANNGYNVGDMFLNINAAGHLQLASVGDTYDLLPLRNWELTNSITANYFIEPDYHFTVTNLNGQEDNSVVKVENELLTAVGEGTALVTVTYDAIHLDQYNGATRQDFVGGSDWGAIWPENTGVFVVTVGEQATGITPNITINKDYLTTVTAWGSTTPIDTKLSMENVDAEFDVLYYLDTEDGYDYTFTPEGVESVTLACPTIGENAATYTGFTAEGVTAGADGSYTLHLTEGRNIVCLTNAAGQSLYQVITVKPCHRDILVDGENVESVKPGDAVTVQYSGLYHPAGKLAGIHNFAAGLTYKQATEGITVKDAAKNQYTMASKANAQAVTFTVPEDFTGTEIDLTDGVMAISGFGDPVGNHRATSKLTGRAPNFTAISQNAVFGRVPAVVLQVEQPVSETPATFEDLVLEAESYWNGSDNKGSFTSGGFQFENGFDVTDYGEWGIFEYAYGFFYSNQTSTDYNGGTSAEQYNSAVGHGAEGSDNYAVYNWNNYANKGINVLGTPRQISGCYLTNNAYTYSSMTKGDSYAKQFAKGDWLKLTIIGLDADGQQTGTVDFYLADLRSEDEAKQYILNEWRWCDLTALGIVSRLEFSMSSSDNGEWGMNTPAYFCLDNLDGEKPADDTTGLSQLSTLNTQRSTLYDLQGRQIVNRKSAPGLYIRDGRKILVK